MPDWYNNEPYIEAIDAFYMKAFYDLSTCRTSGMSIGPIPWTAMVLYADRQRLDWDVTEAFIDIIRQMDNSFVDYQTAEQKRISDANKVAKK